MKTIISEYAGIVIAVIIGLGVFHILLVSEGQKNGILKIAGQVMEAQTKAFLQEQDYTAYDSFLKQEPLEITYKEDCFIYEKDMVVIEEYFSVMDSKGNPVDFEVVEVYDNAGNSCYEQLKNESGRLQFTVAGVYQILIQTKGQNCKNSSVVIAFPVKSEKQRNLTEDNLSAE